jgi:hypothetical protein
MRRSCALVASVVLVISSALAVGAQTAAAAAACTVRANLPARIGVDRDTVLAPVTLSGCEGKLYWAAASVYGASGVVDNLYWEGSRTQYVHVYSDIKPGTYRTIDGSGYTPSGDPIGWQYTSTTIKFSTRTGIAVSRSGSTVNITVATYRFAAYQGFIGYGNHVVAVQHSLTANGPWTTIAYAKVNAAGRVTIRRTASAPRYYRAYFGDSGSFFGSYSGAVRR